jgi:hypothetical protein
MALWSLAESCSRNGRASGQPRGLMTGLVGTPGRREVRLMRARLASAGAILASKREKFVANQA